MFVTVMLHQCLPATYIKHVSRMLFYVATFAGCVLIAQVIPIPQLSLI